MFDYTRQEAAEILGISTRSLDRAIKSGKIRSKKEGKIVYIHNDDVMRSTQKVEVISRNSVQDSPQVETSSTNSMGDDFMLATKNFDSKIQLFEKYMGEFQKTIEKKDQKIEELSIELGQAREAMKQSVGIVEFKKSQFLLEESKSHLNNKIESLENSVKSSQEQLRYEKNTNRILLIVLVILVFGGFIFWFLSI